jgi:hypothetical protein
METTQGISLFSYLYLNLAKMLCLSYYLLYLFFYKIEEQEDGAGSSLRVEGRGKVVQIIYTHVCKCKNDTC